MAELNYNPKYYPYSKLRNKSGIYQIRNIITNKLYIGSTKNLSRRRTEHFSALRHNRHHNMHLQYSYNKYGESNFIFEVIEFAERSELENLESYYIKLLNTIKNGYNIISDTKINTNCEIPVICLETGEVYKSMVEASNITGIHNTNIGANCLKKYGTAGGKHWMYYSDYLKASEDDINKLMDKEPLGIKLIYCYENQQIYNSASEAGRILNVPSSKVLACCKGIRKHTKGYHFFYLKDYNNYSIQEINDIVNAPYVMRHKVLCIENNKVFMSCKEASKNMKLNRERIAECCKGIRSDVKGYHFRYADS